MSKIAKAPGFTVSESKDYRQIPAERLKRFDGYYFVLPTSKAHEQRLPVMGATAGTTHLEAVDVVPNSPTKNRASLAADFRFKLIVLDNRQQVEHPNGTKYSAYFHMLPKTGFTPPQSGAQFAGPSSGQQKKRSPQRHTSRPPDNPPARQDAIERGPPQTGRSRHSAQPRTQATPAPPRQANRRWSLRAMFRSFFAARNERRTRNIINVTNVSQTRSPSRAPRVVLP